MYLFIQKINNFSWFSKRFCGLLCKFPDNLTPETLQDDSLFRNYDKDLIISSLKQAHTLINDVCTQLRSFHPEDKASVYQTFAVIDLLWLLGAKGDLLQAENGAFYFSLTKMALNGRDRIAKTAPDSMIKSLKEIAMFSKCVLRRNGQPVPTYQRCDQMEITFFLPLAALGIWLFVQKLLRQPIPPQKYKKHVRIWGRELHRAVPAFLYPAK